MQLVSIVVGIIVLLLLWGWIEQKILMTTRYQVISTKLDREWNDTTFVVLADLHNNKFGKENKRLMRKLEEISPEFIILAGDIINKKSKCLPSNTFTLMEQLSQKYKIYYAWGNHEQHMELLPQHHQDKTDTSWEQDYRLWLEFKKRLSRMNVTFIDNNSRTLQKNNKSIRITGVSIDREFFERKVKVTMQEGYINTLVGNSDEKQFQILIAHNPIYFKHYKDWGADLTLSGHLHGGMIRLPYMRGLVSPQVKLFPKYDAGSFQEESHTMIVSRGLGSHSVMPRLFNPPELCVITLKSKNFDLPKGAL
jgi:uncharacterized protein